MHRVLPFALLATLCWSATCVRGDESVGPPPPAQPKPAAKSPVMVRGSHLKVTLAKGDEGTTLRIPRSLLDHPVPKADAGGASDGTETASGLSRPATVVAGLALTGAIVLGGFRLVRKPGQRGSTLAMLGVAAVGVAAFTAFADLSVDGPRRAPPVREQPQPTNPEPADASPSPAPQVTLTGITVRVDDEEEQGVRLSLDPTTAKKLAAPSAASKE